MSGRKGFSMGFLDRLFGGRAKTAKETRFPGEKMVVKAPMDGIVLPLEQLPDETFAAAILGPGCGIEPTGKTVYAPFDGTVEQVASTLHAVGLTSEDGIEILIHVGMDTVEMQGKGFKEARVLITDNNVKVIYGNYRSESEAYNTLNRLHTNEAFTDGWITKVKE